MTLEEWLWTKLYVEQISSGFWGDFASAQGLEVGTVREGVAEDEPMVVNATLDIVQS